MSNLWTSLAAAAALCLAAVPASLVPAVAHAADEQAKPRVIEWEVFRADKPVGTETLRITVGKEASYYSVEAKLKDKVGKAWKAFVQRAALQLDPAGTVNQYDRWIVVDGANNQLKLFNFQGQWRTSFVDVYVDGKKPKPKLKDLSVSAPLVVLDERLPSLVMVAAERMDNRTEFDFVRVDENQTGKLTRTVEKLVDAKGKKFVRITMTGGGMKLVLLEDDKGQPISVEGIAPWRAVVKGAKAPVELKPDAPAAGPAPDRGPAPGPDRAPAPAPAPAPGPAPGPDRAPAPAPAPAPDRGPEPKPAKP